MSLIPLCYDLLNLFPLDVLCIRDREDPNALHAICVPKQSLLNIPFQVWVFEFDCLELHFELWD